MKTKLPERLRQPLVDITVDKNPNAVSAMWPALQCAAPASSTAKVWFVVGGSGEAK